MGLPSKEERILELFFNEGSKHWHFKEIVKKAKISEDRANYWLKKLLKEEIIKHITPEGKMPYFIANFEGSNYKNRKVLFAQNKLYQSGLLSHLKSMDAKTIVLFGSFARSDWHSKSDIDLFILGEDDKLELAKYESRLHREIQPHTFKDRKEIKRIRSGLIHNVINGLFIKGKVQDLVEVST